MASMLENTPRPGRGCLPTASLRIRNKTVYELLGDNGFDVSIYALRRRSTGGPGTRTSTSNCSSQDPRDRVGGARGSPSWLPAGERMADWLAQQIGFADEIAMEEYTVEQVGSPAFTPLSPWAVTPPVVPNAPTQVPLGLDGNQFRFRRRWRHRNHPRSQHG